jgi:hypothetical protein
MGARSRSRGGLADAAENTLALDLVLFHGMLVLAGRLGNLLGGKGVDLTDRADAVRVQVGLAK